RPSADLLANLLCPDVGARLALLARMGLEGRLHRLGVLERLGTTGTPVLASQLAIDASWRAHLLGLRELDPQIAHLARLAPSRPSAPRALVPDAVKTRLDALKTRAIA